MAGLSSSVALGVAVVLWVVIRDDPYVAPPPESSPQVVRPAEAAVLLRDLEQVVEAGRVGDVADLVAEGDRRAASRLSAVVRNAGAIPLADVTFRYVDETVGGGAGEEWSATVATTWQVVGGAPGSLAADVRFDFAIADGQVVIGGVGGPGGTTPVWMSGRMGVFRDDRVVVVAAKDVDYYARLARRAVTVVRRVLPAWDGLLVVEVPRSGVGVDAALDVEPGTFRNVAGVTAAGDGSQGDDAPVHVFLNPRQMAELRPAGAQVVVSHEAVHVAVDAPGSAVPVWLSEGFADYVALRDVRLPLSTTAAQVAQQVRRQGTPDDLPDDRDFDEQSEYFGAAYEASWLACRLLVQQHGEATLLRLYRRADGTADFAATFRRTTGTALDDFTRDWQRVLRDLAA